MGGTVIRAARVADASQIAVVHVRSWQGAYRGLLPQAYLDGLDPAERVGRWERSLAEAANDGGNGVLVADASGTLLGFAGYAPSRDGDADPARVGEIDAIYLLPSAWGKGLGRRLMGAALTRLAEAQFDRVTLWVLDSNVRARRFYEAGGWLADGARKIEESRGFPIAQVRYKRSLKPSGTGPALSCLSCAA
jgi:ribosomal protein S18 acetylase RimI-like enzyme